MSAQSVSPLNPPNEVKLKAYPFTRYGVVNGVIEHISRTFPRIERHLRALGRIVCCLALVVNLSSFGRSSMSEPQPSITYKPIMDKCGGLYLGSFIATKAGFAYLANCPGMKKGKYSALEYVKYDGRTRRTHHLESRRPFMMDADEAGRLRWLTVSPDEGGQSGHALQLFSYNPVVDTSTKVVELQFEDSIEMRTAHRGKECWLIKAASYEKPGVAGQDRYVLYSGDSFRRLEGMPARSFVLFWDHRDQQFVMSAGPDGRNLFGVDCRGEKRDVRASLAKALPHSIRSEAEPFFGLEPSPIVALVYFVIDADVQTRRLMFIDLRTDKPIEFEAVDPLASSIYSASASASGKEVAFVFKDSLVVFDVESKKIIAQKPIQSGITNEVAYLPTGQGFVIFNKGARELNYLGDR
ncbi:MAG: hypothetical protein ACREO8_08725 [Luteimonas sp.]